MVYTYIYFSDGAVSQCKNLINLCCHADDHGLLAEWHFLSATSHGKSPCDGIGGTVKRLVARASLQAVADNQILTVSDMFQWAKDHISGIEFFLVIRHQFKKTLLNSNWLNVLQSARLSGIRSHHSFIPCTESVLRMRRLSSDDVFTAVRVSAGNRPDDNMEESEEDVNCNEFQAGKYVACIYDSDWYLGSIKDRSDEHSDVLVSFMKRSKCNTLMASNIKKDECWVPFQHIICTIDAPSVKGTTSRLYTINPEDLQKIKTRHSKFLQRTKNCLVK